MSTDYPHCRHPKCCQCGAVRGTDRHEQDCPDAFLAKKINEGRVSRKLVKK